MFWRKKSGLLHFPLTEGPYVPGCIDVPSDEYLYRIYYPSDLKMNEDHSKRWIPWVHDDQYLVGIAKLAGIWAWIIRLIFAWFAGDMYIPVAYNSQPHKGDKFKVIILSHGLGGSRFLYSTICVELASYGYVVLALEHGDGSASFTTRMKRCISYISTPKNNKDHASLRQNQIGERVKECILAITMLEGINEGEIKTCKVLSSLSNRLDMSSLTLMGHSFGAATALKSLSVDKRFTQGIILDAWMYPINNEKDTLPAEIKQPMLFINTQTFHIEKNLSALRLYIRENDPVYTIRATTHEHQTDMPHLLGSWMNRKMTKIDFKIATKINNHLILRWLQNKGADEQFLNNESHNIIEDLVLATEKDISSERNK